MNERDILAGFQTELQEHLETHRCHDCTRLYYQALRATNIMLESIGGQHVFPNNGTPIEAMENGAKVKKHDPFNCAKCGTIIAEFDPKKWDVGGWRHEQCPDTPETVATKAKRAMDVGQEALRIFGGKK